MSRIVVAYFSAEGTTARIARLLADEAQAELFEIRPATPYTAADINWKNPLSRCNREKLGKKDVPLAAHLTLPADCTTLLLGFPIWYYGAPNIIETFLREMKLDGVKLALFATSGGSDMGRTAARLTPLLPAGTEIAAQRRFLASDGVEEARAFLASL